MTTPATLQPGPSKASPALITALVNLIRAFSKAESEAVTAALAAPVAELTSDRDRAEVEDYQGLEAEMYGEAAEAVNALITQRLVRNDRRVPLLSLRDTDRITGGFLAGKVMDDDAIATLGLMRPRVEQSIRGELAQQGLWGDNGYSAYWGLAAAILAETAASGQTPEELLQLPHARAAVLRRMATPERWAVYVEAAVALFAGFTSSNMLGSMGEMLDDDQAAQMTSGLAAADAEMASTLQAIQAAVRAHLEQRGVEIFGA